MFSSLRSIGGTLSRAKVSVNLTPTVVTPSLRLYLDASNISSYPGTGTTWTDLSSNNYATTLVGNPIWNTTHFTFDGSTTQYVDTNQSLSSESFSVGGWIRTSDSGIRMLISKETPTGSPWNYRIWLNNGQIVADVAEPGNGQGLSSPLSTYNNGNWYLVMFTRDDNNWYLYVNGVQIATRSDPFGGSIVNAQEVWIGRSAFSGAYQWSGDIGQIFVYNRVLNSAEILQNYNATKATYGL